MIKKTQMTLVSALALVAFLAVGCASTQSPETQISDSAITAKVEAKLAADPEINPFNVDVDTNEGIVTLSGAVEKSYAREEAERLAENTDGVLGVRNDITIRDRDMGERIDDAWIVTKIKTKITADPELNPFNINVDSKDGVVTLDGRVKTAADAEEAAKLARDTEGVRSVKNRLKVG